MKRFIPLLVTIIFPLTVLAIDTQIKTDNLKLGKPDTNNKSIIFDVDNGSANPRIRANGTTGKLQFTNDGTVFKDIGSGSGGSGGINMLSNADYEDGYNSGWTNSGGTFAEANASSNTSDLLFGEKSAIFTASGSGQYLESATFTVPGGLKGAACELRVYYKGGDANWTLRVLNADNEQVGQDVVLSTLTETGPISYFFRCPSSTEITNDADKGILRARLVSTAAAAKVAVDNWHAGSLIGLAETTLPDSFSANVADGSSTTTVSGENVDWINGNCTNPAAGSYTCTFNSGLFTQVPVCHATSNISSSNTCWVYGAPTTSSVTIQCRSVLSTPASQDADFSLTCNKAGTDAKQSVQVYKSIPKISENINDFSATIDGTVSPSTVSNENADFINGNCARDSTGAYTCTFNTSMFTTVPNCSCSGTSNTNCTVTATSTSSVSTATRSVLSTPAAANDVFRLSCQRGGTDFKMPTVQPIVLQENKFQMKFLASDVTSNTTGVSGIGYSNLVTGRLYRVCANAYITTTTSSSGTLDTVHNGGTILKLLRKGDGGTSAGDGANSYGSCRIFTAAASTVTFNFTESTVAVLEGTGDIEGTWTSLEELNSYREASGF